MNKKLISKLITLYDDIYTERPYRLKMVCFIVYKSKILSWGVNSDKTSTALRDHSLTTTSIVYTIVSINAGNFVMLGIYFYCRHKKSTHAELKRMKAKELF